VEVVSALIEMAPDPARILTTPSPLSIPKFTPLAALEVAAFPAGLDSSEGDARPPPIVMSPPEESINAQLLKVTPPDEAFVVHNVMSPPDVSSFRGDAEVPVEVVIRPADLTRIPALPEVMLEFKVVVAADSASMDTELPAVIGPFPELPTVMFPEAESLTVFAEIVALLVLRVDDPPDMSTVPTEAVNAPPPEKVDVGRMFIEPFEVVTAVVWVTADP